MSAVRFRRFAPMAAAAAIWFAAHAALPATFVVNSTGDEPDKNPGDGICNTSVGTCTLRAALLEASGLIGEPATIQFNIPGSGVHTISPTSELPFLLGSGFVTIDGYTQPGASPNTLTVGNNAVLLVEIDGANAGPLASGLVSLSFDAVSIRGLVINRFLQSGIELIDPRGGSITGCFLGTDPTGTISMSNGVGIRISSAGGGGGGSARGLRTENATPLPMITIGGIAPEDRNLISGNAFAGITAGSKDFFPSVAIEGNYIGTDAFGEVALPNRGPGLDLKVTQSVVGGGSVFTAPNPQANVISGNSGDGVSLESAGLNTVSGNFIGTNASGTHTIGNQSGVHVEMESSDFIQDNVISGNVRGIEVLSSDGIHIDHNHIGTDISGSLLLGNRVEGVVIVGDSFDNAVGQTSANVIAFNGGRGVAIGSGPTAPLNDNRIQGNSIHDNGGLGIDLGYDGVTPNNDCDGGRGPNLGQNFPILASAVLGPASVDIVGTLNSVPNTPFLVDFYANRLCSKFGDGEGEICLGSAVAETDPKCNTAFDVTFLTALPAGSFITATATDPAGNTSEFSPCMPVDVGMSFFSTGPCRLADTRGSTGPLGGPALTPLADRTFQIVGNCGIPADARSVAFNFTITGPTTDGDLEIVAVAPLFPVPPTIWYSTGQTRAKHAVLPLGPNGEIAIRADQHFGTVDLIIDVAGYFR